VFKPSISTYGEHTILLKWPAAITPELHEKILVYESLITAKFELDILDIIVTYTEMAIYLKPKAFANQIVETIHAFEIETTTAFARNGVIWQIPVCYEPHFGLDLEAVAFHNNISVDQVSALHVSQPYRIYFTGFLPGFLYLGGLPERIATPRKETPRLVIPKGAVAIAGTQTGIYPTESPGGWQIIGKTPVELFNVEQSPPSPFNAGDFIQFESISKNQYDALALEVAAGIYKFKKTPQK
jgi:inhibitor of KinA